MAVREIRLFGDPILLTAAEPVTDFDKQLRGLVKDLMSTLLDSGGSGLAAPQIGVGLRVFAYDVDGQRGHLVNPVLQFPDAEEQDGEEGCMSFPGLYFDVKRRRNTVARGFTDRGDPVQVVGTATLARCLQHETDHLDGILFIDRMDNATRRAAMKAIREAPWSGLSPMVRVSPHPVRGPLRLSRWLPGAPSGAPDYCGHLPPRIGPRWLVPGFARIAGRPVGRRQA